MIIIDECHHAASATFLNILQEIRAKYVYGVTATPARGDGMEKINYMIIGSVRYKYTAKERAYEQGIEHLVYPRFTRTVAPFIGGKKLHVSEAYVAIREDADRDDLIVRDIKKCIAKGRTPVVLSKFREHSHRLYKKLDGSAQHIFFLTGNNSKKEQRKILQQMFEVPDSETMILVATGQLIGEGFDYPRLDTLIMAAPVSWKGIVEQYAGRLNRDYPGKNDVVIYDYVDIHIDVFDKMYNKRLKAYKQIGYKICADIERGSVHGETNGRDWSNAIYDYESYADVFRSDLLEAKKEIVISSPVISDVKIERLIVELMEKQAQGVKVMINTWSPDTYGFGDSGYWSRLHEKMRKSGFEIHIAEEYCERFAAIDREIVWYGSLNFLGKEDIDDNLMRVVSKEIAAELMEMTFKDGIISCII